MGSSLGSAGSRRALALGCAGLRLPNEATRRARPGVEGGNRRPGPSQCLFRVQKMVIKHPRAWLGCAGAAGRLNLGIGRRPRASAAMAAGYAPARRGSTTHGRPWLPFGALSAHRRRGIRLYRLGVAIGGHGPTPSPGLKTLQARAVPVPGRAWAHDPAPRARPKVYLSGSARHTGPRCTITTTRLSVRRNGAGDARLAREHAGDARSGAVED